MYKQDTKQMLHLAGCLLLLLLAIVPCRGLLFDEPADCLLSKWGEWTTLPGLNKQIRERSIIRYDVLGGVPCPSNTLLRQVKRDSQPPSAEDTPEQIQATARSISQNFIRRRPKADDPNEPGHFRDLLMILDSSGSIGNSSFEQTKRNLVELLGMLCPQPDPFSKSHQHAALIDFSKDVVEIFDFNKYQTMTELTRGIMNVSHMGDTTCTAKALNYSKTIMSPHKGMRTDYRVNKEVLILTDGASNCGGDAIASALSLQSQATVFSLQIGPMTNRGLTEIINYVSTPIPDHLFSVKSYTGFEQLMTILRQQIHLVPCAPFDLPGSG